MTDAKLKAYVERYERLAEERKGIGADMAEVLSEAEGNGYDKPGLRRLIAWRALNAADRQEREITDEMYRAAIAGEPLPRIEVAPVDPVLQRAIAMYRTGATVREVQAAFKADGHKIALGTAHKLRVRARPFLDAEKRAAAEAFKPTATVHVHPAVNVNKATGEITQPISPTGSAHEGDDDGRMRSESGGRVGAIAGQRSDGRAVDGDGVAGRPAGRQSAPTAGHDDGDRGAAGRLLAAPDADAAGGEPLVTDAAGAAAGHAGLAALHGGDDGHGALPAGRDHDAPARTAIIETRSGDGASQAERPDTLDCGQTAPSASLATREREAPGPTSHDDLEFPKFLRRGKAGSVRALDAAHPYERVITGSVT